MNGFIVVCFVGGYCGICDFDVDWWGGFVCYCEWCKLDYYLCGWGDYFFVWRFWWFV